MVLGKETVLLTLDYFPSCSSPKNQMMSAKNSLVAIFEFHERAEAFIREF
jgi:hypothetical protein